MQPNHFLPKRGNGPPPVYREAPLPPHPHLMSTHNKIVMHFSGSTSRTNIFSYLKWSSLLSFWIAAYEVGLLEKKQTNSTTHTAYSTGKILQAKHKYLYLCMNMHVCVCLCVLPVYSFNRNSSLWSAWPAFSAMTTSEGFWISNWRTWGDTGHECVMTITKGRTMNFLT